MKKSFKKVGINLSFDCSEDYNLIWPKQSDLILVEDIHNKKEPNNEQKINFYFRGKSDNNYEYDEDEKDFLFDSD